MGITSYVPTPEIVTPYVAKFGDIYVEKLKRDEDKKQRDIQNAQAEQQLLQQREAQERNDAINLQKNALTMIQGLTDQDSVSKLVKAYNKQPLVSKYELGLPDDNFSIPSKKTDPLAKEMAAIKATNPNISEDEARKRAGQKVLDSSDYEKESSKLSAKRVDAIQTELTLAEEQIINNQQALDNLNTMIKNGNSTPDMFAPVKIFLGNALSTVGIDTSTVKDWKDLGKLEAQITNLSIKDFRKILGAQFTAREAEMVTNAYGSISDPTEKVKFLMELRIDSAKNEIISKTTEAILLDGGVNKIKAQNIANKVKTMPPVIISNTHGKKTFSEFSQGVKAKHPDARMTDIINSWIEMSNQATGERRPSIMFDEKSAQLLNEY